MTSHLPWRDVRVGDRTVSIFHGDGLFYALSLTDRVVYGRSFGDVERELQKDP